MTKPWLVIFEIALHSQRSIFALHWKTKMSREFCSLRYAASLSLAEAWQRLHKKLA